MTSLNFQRSLFVMYVASSAGPFRSENGGGDVLRDETLFYTSKYLSFLSSAKIAQTGLNSEKILKNQLKR